MLYEAVKLFGECLHWLMSKGCICSTVEYFIISVNDINLIMTISRCILSIVVHNLRKSILALLKVISIKCVRFN